MSKEGPLVEEVTSEALARFLSNQTFYTQGFVRCEGFLLPRCFLQVEDHPPPPPRHAAFYR